MLKLEYDMLSLATTDTCQEALQGKAPYQATKHISCLQTGLAQQCKQHSLQTAALSSSKAAVATAKLSKTTQSTQYWYYPQHLCTCIPFEERIMHALFQDAVDMGL